MMNEVMSQNHMLFSSARRVKGRDRSCVRHIARGSLRQQTKAYEQMFQSSIGSVMVGANPGEWRLMSHLRVCMENTKIRKNTRNREYQF